MTPFISIVIPCYNHATYLKDCIDSIISQSFQNWEAIIVNDGSTDETTLVALSYKEKDSRINIIEKANGGLSSARNYGLKGSKGKWVIFLDADDILLPNHLSKVVSKIEEQPQAKCVQTGYTHFSEDIKKKLHSVLPYLDKIMPFVLTQNLGPVHTIVIRKDIIQSLGPFDESLNSCEDWDMWIRLGKSGIEKISINEPLVGYRRAVNSMSRNAFQMYNALKTVTLRAVRKDSRLPDIGSNRDYNEVSTQGCLKKSLLLCLGVSIMQGEIQESVNLFNSETKIFTLNFIPADFAIMNSYLSFRYMTSKSEVHTVLNEFMISFQSFFSILDFDEEFTMKAIDIIFKKHQHLYRRMKIPFLGKIMELVDSFVKK